MRRPRTSSYAMVAKEAQHFQRVHREREQRRAGAFLRAARVAAASAREAHDAAESRREEVLFRLHLRPADDALLQLRHVSREPQDVKGEVPQ